MKFKKIGPLIILAGFALTYALMATMAYNYEYFNVTTKANITNAYPEILSIKLEQNIILSAGTSKIVQCNISARDYNGYNEMVLVNATLFHNTSTSGAADDNNTHYTNSNCTPPIWNDGSYIANFTCNFTMWYFANSGNWTCNVTVMDDYNFTDIDNNMTSLQTYYALNVTNNVLDYGEMILSSYSDNMTINLTNIGNGLINISVKGYGGNNQATGAGYAMICESGNITIGNEKFSTNQSDDWATKTELTSTLQNLTDVSIPKTTIGMPNWNLTYWQLFTDPTNRPFGVCNGTIEFTAILG